MRIPATLAALLIILLCVASTGCVAPPLRLLPPRPVTEIPAANLPVSLRPFNWTDARGSGSCVHASTVFNLHWTNQPARADWWRRSHAGGETSTTIRQYHDAAGLRYYFTLQGDPKLLDWCTATRRSALIWYFPRHCINFNGFHRGVDGAVYAHLIDNNRPTQVLRVERQKFLAAWSGYGGFALTLADPPAPPPLYDAIERQI